MIKISYDNEYKIIHINGHSDYASYGKDIVCASVSSIVATSVNLALDYDSSLIYIDKDDKVIIENNTNNDNVLKILKNMICMLEELAKQYPKNIKISKGE